MSQELRDRVRGFPDVEIVEAFLNPDAYTPESLRIIEEEADARGGREAMTERVRAAIKRERLLRGTLPDVRAALAAGRQPEEIIRSLAAKGIAGDDTKRMVTDAEAAHRRMVHEQTDTPRSLSMAVVGGAVASIVGGVYCDLLFFGSKGVFGIHAVGLLLLVFGIVRLFSGGKKTGAVGAISAVAVTLAFLIGWWLYSNHVIPGR